MLFRQHEFMLLRRLFSSKVVIASSKKDVIIKDGSRVDLVNGNPPTLSTSRHVYIYQPSKSAMQTGMGATGSWKLEFDHSQARWENPMMGWTSSRDPMQAVQLKFAGREEAVRFAERNGWTYTIREGNKHAWKAKSYGDNFTYSPGPLRIIKTK